MNTGQQFKHYVWIVNTLRQRRRMTLKELNDLWVTDYHYYISNPGEIDSDMTTQWILSTLTTGLTLSGSTAIKDNILIC